MSLPLVLLKVSPKQSTEDHPGNSSASSEECRVPSRKGLAEPMRQALHLLQRQPLQLVAPNLAQAPHPPTCQRAPDSCYTRPERQLAITYDQSEEELMASIEQEFCS
ncbi:hypothetical protein CB1_001616077 [Camelus ferus]|nr:hypothetical protein CB1_001616077 [Camelus ferus]